MLFYSSISDLRNLTSNTHIDEIWLCVRSLKSQISIDGITVRHMPVLSPSWYLFKKYRQMVSNGTWSQKAFDEVYTPIFLGEMKTHEAKAALRELYNLSAIKNVVVCCYCKDEKICHRSLIKKLMLKKKEIDNKYSEPFYLLASGSRSFNDYGLLERKLNALLSRRVGLKQKIVIVSGGAKGADTLALRYAEKNGYEVKVFEANWEADGKSAGFKRNKVMADYLAEKAHKGCVAFWDNKSKGTKHQIDYCKSKNIDTRVVYFLEENKPMAINADEVQ